MERKAGTMYVGGEAVLDRVVDQKGRNPGNWLSESHDAKPGAL